METEIKMIANYIASGINTEDLIKQKWVETHKMNTGYELLIENLLQARYIGVTEIFQRDSFMPYYFLTKRGIDLLQLKHKIIV
jgi:hypothetical protein